MSAVQDLLAEREQLEREIESGRFMLTNINRSLAEDQKMLDAHHSARVEIAVGLAVREARLEVLNDELLALADEVEGDERLESLGEGERCPG
ncbi:MAG: hypothetical protein ABW250_00630 [Pyrinomonadaceae bacterium]